MVWGNGHAKCTLGAGEGSGLVLTSGDGTPTRPGVLRTAGACKPENERRELATLECAAPGHLEAGSWHKEKGLAWIILSLIAGASPALAALELESTRLAMGRRAASHTVTLRVPARQNVL
jgi:hypothetical protein